MVAGVLVRIPGRRHADPLERSAVDPVAHAAASPAAAALGGVDVVATTARLLPSCSRASGVCWMNTPVEDLRAGEAVVGRPEAEGVVVRRAVGQVAVVVVRDEGGQDLGRLVGRMLQHAAEVPVLGRDHPPLGRSVGLIRTASRPSGTRR